MHDELDLNKPGSVLEQKDLQIAMIKFPLAKEESRDAQHVGKVFFSEIYEHMSF